MHRFFIDGFFPALLVDAAGLLEILGGLLSSLQI